MSQPCEAGVAVPSLQARKLRHSKRLSGSPRQSMAEPGPESRFVRVQSLWPSPLSSLHPCAASQDSKTLLPPLDPGVPGSWEGCCPQPSEPHGGGDLVAPSPSWPYMMSQVESLGGAERGTDPTRQPLPCHPLTKSHPITPVLGVAGKHFNPEGWRVPLQCTVLSPCPSASRWSPR